VSVKINKRRTDQGGCFHRDPEQSEMLADRHQGHHAQKNEQAADKNRFPCIGKKHAFFKILALPPVLPHQISECIDRCDQKQQAGNA